MAYNVFISFRYNDGVSYKNTLSDLFSKNNDTVDYSEDMDRSYLTESSIQRYLYGKLRRTSVTIILLTPNAINHHKDYLGHYDDWMYDEIRYSLEDRDYNRTNGLVAVYTPEAADKLLKRGQESNTIFNVDNLFRKNMMNVKERYKTNPKPQIYDSNYDSYCSLVDFSSFISNPGKYIDIAVKKRDELYKYNLVKRL